MSLILCLLCHEYYRGERDYAICPHNNMQLVVPREDYCYTHNLIPSQFSGEICPLCNAGKIQSYNGKSVRFTSGFYQGELGIILRYRGHSAVCGNSFEVILNNGVRIITTERHIKIYNGNKVRHRSRIHAER